MSRNWPIIAVALLIIAMIAAPSCAGGCRISDAHAWFFGDAEKTMNVFTFILVALAVFQIAEARRVAREQAADSVDALARALHVELSEFVARCCFDFEFPWGQYLKEKHAAGEMDHFRLNKFVPASPMIYEATASQIARLNGTAPQCLIQFYYRVAAWRRDAANMADRLRVRDAERQSALPHRPPILPIEDARVLASRLKETLEPGFKALVALGELVDKPEDTENAAIEAHDRISRRGLIVSEISLRKRIAMLLAEN